MLPEIEQHEAEMHCGGRRRYLSCVLDLTTLVQLGVFLIRLELVHGQLEADLIDRLVEKWAPLVWLAPEEKYFPLAAEEFLQHVHPVDVNGRIISSEDTLPIGRSSETLYLIPKNDLASLKGNTTSFLNGRNPLNEVVPVYVTVSECSRPSSIVNPCLRSYKSNVFGNCDEKNDLKKPTARRIHFHLTYWMFYPYNEGKEVCFLGKIPTPLIFNRCLGKKRRFGNHIGDFEHVSISFDEDYVPSELFLAIHDIGAYYTYDSISKIFKYSRELVRKGIIQRAEFPPVVRTFKGRPVLFAAKGSHGLWSAPGQFTYLRVPKLYDLNGYGTPWKTWKSFQVYRIGYDPPPVWMKYLGRWGIQNLSASCLIGLEFASFPKDLTAYREEDVILSAGSRC